MTKTLFIFALAVCSVDLSLAQSGKPVCAQIREIHNDAPNQFKNLKRGIGVARSDRNYIAYQVQSRILDADDCQIRQVGSVAQYVCERSVGAEGVMARAYQRYWYDAISECAREGHINHDFQRFVSTIDIPSTSGAGMVRYTVSLISRGGGYYLTLAINHLA